MKNMDILKTLKRQIKGKAGRLKESAIYAEVMKEIKSGKRHDGIWGQAFSETEGDEKKADALYIKLRVQSVKDELEIFKENISREQQTKNNSKQKINSSKKKNAKKEVDEASGCLLFLFYGFIVTFITIGLLVIIGIK